MIKNWAKLGLIMVTLGVLFWPGIRNHWELTNNPYFVPFDAAQYIPPFFKYDSKDPIPTTYTKEYHLNVVCPLLYRWLFAIGAHYFDARNLQLWMMYFAYGVFIVVLGRLGWSLGGAALCFAVAAFALTSQIFIGMGFIGGSAKMYAYPLISVILYSLIHDRPKYLAATIVLGGLLYPITAIIGGFCLTIWLLIRPLSSQGLVSQWGLKQRMGILALTGFLTMTGAVDFLVGSAPYGRRVVEADIQSYPEAGPNGNYRPFDRLPYKLFGNEWVNYYVGPLYSHGDPILPAFNAQKNLDSLDFMFAIAGMAIVAMIVIMSGIRRLLKKDQSGVGTRVISFFVVCGVLHVVAWIASPYLYIPIRYFMFSLPFLITLIFPWSLYLLLKRVPQLGASSWLHDAVFLGLIFVYLMVFGARGNVQYAGSTLDNASKSLLDAVGRLPKNALIAGWPAGELKKVEYVTRRNAFLTQDIHQVLHFDFMKAMHHRMDALFDAYLSTDATPLNRLRREFGITHLLIETRHFSDPKYPPEYFAPWNARIKSRLTEIKGNEYLMRRSLHEKAAIFTSQDLVLLDLTKLP